MPRASVPWIPDDGGLSLVGDADGRQIAASEAGGAQRAGDHLVDAGSNLDGIVFDPTGARQNLCVLDLTARDFLAAVVEHHESRAGGSLIQGTYEHDRCPSCTISSSSPLM
jgi:hypothetical protein